MSKASGLAVRLDAHVALGRITKTQPAIAKPGAEGRDDMSPSELRALQKDQVRSALARGVFAMNLEIYPLYTAFLRKLNPSYAPPLARSRSSPCIVEII